MIQARQEGSDAWFTEGPAELLGVKVSRATDGQSLVPLMSGEERQQRPALSGRTKSGPPRFSRVVNDGQRRTGQFRCTRCRRPAATWRATI